MAAQFVPYTPDVDTVEPNFDQNLQTVIGKTESYIAESVEAGGTGRALRDAHAKGYGLVRGEGGDPGRASARVRPGHLCDSGNPRCAHPLLQRIAPRRSRRATGRRHRTGAEDVRHPRPDPAGGRTGLGHIRLRQHQRRSSSATRSSTTCSSRSCSWTRRPTSPRADPARVVSSPSS
jgi:hypothetical protein